MHDLDVGIEAQTYHGRTGRPERLKYKVAMPQ